VHSYLSSDVISDVRKIDDGSAARNTSWTPLEVAGSVIFAKNEELKRNWSLE
jgi:hypothetical protein